VGSGSEQLGVTRTVLKSDISSSAVTASVEQVMIIWQLLKKLPDFYAMSEVAAVFTKARHWIPSLSQMNPSISFTHYFNIYTFACFGLPSTLCHSAF
jgi:hypothetical protein